MKIEQPAQVENIPAWVYFRLLRFPKKRLIEVFSFVESLHERVEQERMEKHEKVKLARKRKELDVLTEDAIRRLEAIGFIKPVVR